MRLASPDLNNAVITDIAYIGALSAALANNSYRLVASSIEIYRIAAFSHLELSIRFILALFLNRQ